MANFAQIVDWSFWKLAQNWFPQEWSLEFATMMNAGLSQAQSNDARLRVVP